MKVILALLFSFPLFSLAQDCAIKKQVDPYSKETKLTTGFFNLGGGMAVAVFRLMQVKLI